jgi:hypothetical protein
LSSRHLGYVSATLTGAPQTAVTLSENDQAGHSTVTMATLPADGTLTVPQALTDLCTVRSRTLIATATTPSARQTASAALTTPACTTRLASAVATGARVGTSVSVRLRDRWGTGDLPVTICWQPPGGNTSCRPDRLATGEKQTAFQLPLPRIGGWLVTTYVPGGIHHQATIWASHPGPIRLLAAGDSEMQILDDDIGQDLAPYGVAVTSFAQPSTGLTNPFLLNWQNTARQLVKKIRPDISIVSMGANDGYPIGTGSDQINCCGEAWTAGYGQLVTRMARTLLQGQSATAYWFVLATPKPANFQEVFDDVNGGIRDAAHTLAGRLGLIDANAFFTPGNRYRNHMTVDGQGFTIHEPDGIHLGATADQFAAQLVVKQLLADRVLRRAAPPRSAAP